MNLLSLLQHLAAADAAPQPTPRRAALAQVARTAAAALPLVAGTASAALAQRTGTTLDALQLLLRVSWLQDELYGRALGATPVTPPVSPTLVPAALRPDFVLMRTQIQQQIAVLETFVRNSGAVVSARPRYDFTGSRNGQQPALFADVFTSTDTLLALAQVLADMSVRTYLSQIGFLQGNADMLEVLGRMLAVFGRYAAHLRLLRQQRGAAVKPWISSTDGGGPLASSTGVVYAGEDRRLQPVSLTLEVDSVTILPLTPALTDAEKTAAATEALDEPLAAAQVSALLGLFSF